MNQYPVCESRCIMGETRETPTDEGSPHLQGELGEILPLYDRISPRVREYLSSASHGLDLPKSPGANPATEVSTASLCAIPCNSQRACAVTANVFCGAKAAC